jgi:ABC-type glycerol-3-phosphate transport system substrate-binding protein
LLGDFVIIRDIVGAAIEDAVVNDVDPQEALSAANEESNQVLEDYAALNQ